MAVNVEYLACASTSLTDLVEKTAEEPEHNDEYEEEMEESHNDRDLDEN